MHWHIVGKKAKDSFELGFNNQKVKVVARLMVKILTFLVPRYETGKLSQVSGVTN